MRHLTLDEREKLDGWLNETGELYVYIHRVHGGGSGTAYFCRAVAEIDELLSRQAWPELFVHIFRRVQYPLRGIANTSLLTEALQQIPDGEWFHIVSLDRYYPSECIWHGDGNTHAELRKEFAEVIGQRVGIGYNPFDRHDAWTYTSPDEVLVLPLKGSSGQYACA